MSYLSSFISKFSARSLANSVLPVPVGPRNRNEAIGRLALPMPEKLMYTRSNTLSTAASCPYRRCLMLLSNSTILVLRSFCKRSNGTSVTRLTWAMIMSLVMVTVPASRTRSLAQAPSNRSILLSGFLRSCM